MQWFVYCDDIHELHQVSFYTKLCNTESMHVTANYCIRFNFRGIKHLRTQSHTTVFKMNQWDNSGMVASEIKRGSEVSVSIYTRAQWAINNDVQNSNGAWSCRKCVLYILYYAFYIILHNPFNIIMHNNYYVACISVSISIYMSNNNTLI